MTEQGWIGPLTTYNRRTVKKYSRRRKEAMRQPKIPKYMTQREKQNLKRNLTTLGEKKYLYSLIATTSISGSSPGPIDLTAVPQGDGDSTRDGDQLSIRSLEYRMTWSSPWGSLSPIDHVNVVRCIIFQWFPNTSAGAPATADILLDPTSGITAVNSPYNHDRRFNFKILFDKSNVLNYEYGTTAFHYRVMITKNMKRKIQYNAGGTTGTNKIYVLLISDSDAVAHPQANFGAKLNYSDF